MISQSIAKRYAKGLFNVGERDGKYKEYLIDFEGILQFLDKEEGLRKVLTLPIVEIEKRKELLSEVMRAVQAAPPLASLFSVLLEKNRMNYLTLIKDQYVELVDEKEGRLKGTVWSAYPLEEATKNNIEKQLSVNLKKEVVLSSKEDRELIGGIKVMIKGTIIDGSIRHQLETLRENILKE